MITGTAKICAWCGQWELHGNNKRHKDGLANGCKKCRREDQTKYWNEGGAKEIGKVRRQRNKIEAFEAYGGCKCIGCGETELVVLSIDHINGGGSKHRKTLTANFYNWLKTNKFPPGYRVLCMNCQWRARFGVLVIKDTK